MTEAVQFMNDYCDFSNPNWVWIMTGLSRNKDQSIENPHSFIRRMIITKPEDIESCYEETLAIATSAGTIYRLYISLNARDVVKGAFHFQKKMADIGYDLARGLPDAIQQSKKLGSIWKTELAQRACRGTKRFLLDIDDNDDEQKALAIVAYLNQTVKTKVHCMRRTVSGWAIVFDACDTRGLLPFVNELGIKTDDNTLQRDSLIYVDRWQGAGVVTPATG